MRPNERFFECGQSVIIVALLMLALIIFAALAVDGSSAYAHRRTAQNAADAAALGGAQELGRQINGKAESDTAIKVEINDFAERNGILDSDGTPGNAVNDNVIGYYVDQDGAIIAGLAPVGSLGYVPNDAFGVEVVTAITAPSFLGRAAGFDGYPLNAEAAAHFQEACSEGDCILPIAIHADGFDPDSGLPLFQEGQCYNLWDGAGTGNFGWLNWSVLDFPCGNDVGDDCSSQCLSYNMDPAHCNRDGALEVTLPADIGGTSGIKNASFVRGWLDTYIGRGGTEPIIAKIIVYDGTNGAGGCGKKVGGKMHGALYHAVGFASVRITGYRLSKGGGFVEYDIPCSEASDITTCTTPGLAADPTGCVDYPSPTDPDGKPWETGKYNRITGIMVPSVGGESGSCHAVGNLLAPRLSK